MNTNEDSVQVIKLQLSNVFHSAQLLPTYHNSISKQNLLTAPKGIKYYSNILHNI